MKQFLLSLFILPVAVIIPALGQKVDTNPPAYSVGAQYTHEFVLDGFVRVREWELTGDKISLKDLGMSNYPAVQLFVTKHFRNNSSLTFAYDRFFMSGKATFDRNITYNGTIIDGTQGIDVSPTRYNRGTFTYRKTVLERRSLDMGYTAGIVVDHVVFYLDGKVSPDSPKDEVFEGFGRQAFPYPFAGLNGKIRFDRVSHLNAEVSGTYIPEFKSFYTEGGRINLQYSLLQADIHYARKVSDVKIVLGARLRYMHLFQESREDTNILRTFTGGPYIGLQCDF